MATYTNKEKSRAKTIATKQARKLKMESRVTK